MAEHRLAAQGIGLRFDADCGMLRGLAVQAQGREMRPMHRVPWAGEVLPEGSLPHLRAMEGDFFCAPFADGGGTAPMLHGHPANALWTVAQRSDGSASLTATLAQTVQGARLTKSLHLRNGHPFVYQRHVFEGGSGTISLANHAMVSLPNGGHLSFSPKTHFRTPEGAPEPDPSLGRSALAYPALCRDPRRFPAKDGGTLDLTRYPFRPGHEDFVVATEAVGRSFGWTAVVLMGFGEVFLSLRDPGLLPITMLWHSDGGRDYAPWSGRHRACLGIEEGHAPHMLGEAGGLPLGRLDIRHAIGVISWPSEEPVRDVVAEGGQLRVTGEGGAQGSAPFDLGHLYS